MKLDESGIFVNAPAAQIEFYRGGLGFEIKENFAAVDKAFRRAVSKGAKPVTEPWGQRACYIADPEGNLIEIGSFTKEQAVI